MTDDTFLAELRYAEAASKARRMSKQQKERLLRSRGWANNIGNRWTSRDGTDASFGNAVVCQLLIDLERSK
jgi:hypothetical protein